MPTPDAARGGQTGDRVTPRRLEVVVSWILMALAACGSPEEGGEDTAAPSTGEESPPAYETTGPYPVGTETITFTGTDGLELTLQVWYPATEEGSQAIEYDGLLPGDAFEDVPADCGETRPVVAFSHGFGGIRYQSPFFTEHLASWGYVVVAPDHPGNTFLDPNGDFLELVARRPQDVADAVDGLLASTAAPCVDPAGGYAVSGHSFGGYTALAAAGATVNDFVGGTMQLGDPRVWASIGLAPWDGAGALTDGTSEIDVPVLILTGELDETTPIGQVDGLWEPLVVEPRFYGVFPKGGHYSFSPIACAYEDGDGCGDGFLDEETVATLTNGAALSFLEGVRVDPAAFDGLPLDAPQLVWETAP